MDNKTTNTKRDNLKGYKPRPLPSVVSRTKYFDFKVPSQDKKISLEPVIAPKSNPDEYYRQSVVVAKDYSNKVQKPQTVNIPAPAPKFKSTKKSNKKLAGIALTVLAFIVSAIAIYANINFIKDSDAVSQSSSKNNQNTEVMGDSDTTNSVSDVDETKPDSKSVSRYSVAPDMPRMLYIDKIAVKSRVKRVGVDNKNEILTPKNVYDVGWYEGSSKPNQPGAVFINGHVSGPTNRGIFYNLKKLTNNDVIKIEMGNGEVLQYRVVHTETVNKDTVDMNKVLVSYDVDKKGLNLMTCSGDFDKQNDTFNQRRIVYAIQI
ncbi:MAG: class F sortase [Patescibacteria group bacterium]|nr:class F sortase [Patescibacteria group bacterium]